ncbi:MAG: thioredoxin [Spirochaetota bacterium]
MSGIISTTDADFENDIKDPQRLVIVDMWAEWCGPCIMMEPVLKEIAEEHQDTVKIVKLNIDQNQQTPLRLNVMNIPTFIFFKEGKEVERIIGAFPKKQFVKKIEELL